MMTIPGHFYDGKTSRETPAVCRLGDNGVLSVVPAAGGEPLLRAFEPADVRISPRLADTPRYLYFPGGAKFETTDNDAVDRLAARRGRPGWLALVHRLESRKRYVAAAVILMVLFIWGMGRYGIPAAARVVAFALPPSAAELAADQTLAALDRSVFDESRLDAAVQQRIQKHLARAIQEHPGRPLAVLFRQGGPIGANALALPDGRIIFTDEMVAISENDDELLAVFAHEIGHVVHRHGLRRVVQDSLLAFALMAITGDVSGTSELFYGLPVMLTELAYSRSFEREADAYALSYLSSRQIPPSHFARIMRRLEQQRREDPDADAAGWTDYLSTHPSTQERLRAFED